MNTAQAIEAMEYLANLAERHETAAGAMLELEGHIRAFPEFTSDVRDSGRTRGAVNWLRAWGRTPSVYMYRLAGGYDTFLRYKYMLRSGEASADIPDIMNQLVIDTFQDLPKNVWGEYDHNVPKDLIKNAEYE